MQYIQRRDHSPTVQGGGHMINGQMPTHIQYVQDGGQMMHPQMQVQYRQEQFFPVQGQQMVQPCFQNQSRGTGSLMSPQSFDQYQYAQNQHQTANMAPMQPMTCSRQFAQRVVQNNQIGPIQHAGAHFQQNQMQFSQSPQLEDQMAGPSSFMKQFENPKQDSMSFYRRFKRINNEQPTNAIVSRNDQILGGHRVAFSSEHGHAMESTQPRFQMQGAVDAADTQELQYLPHKTQQHFMVTSPGGAADSTRHTGLTGVSQIQMASYSLNNNVYRDDQVDQRQSELDLDSFSNQLTNTKLMADDQSSQIDQKSNYNGQNQNFNNTNNSNINQQYQETDQSIENHNDKNMPQSQARVCHRNQAAFSMYGTRNTQMNQSEQANLAFAAGLQTRHVFSSNSTNQSQPPQAQSFPDQFILTNSIDSTKNANFQRSFYEYADPSPTQTGQAQLGVNQQHSSILVKRSVGNPHGDGSASQSPSNGAGTGLGGMKSNSMHAQPPSAQFNYGRGYQQQQSNPMLQNRSISDNNQQSVVYEPLPQQNYPRYQEESAQHINMTPNHQQQNHLSQHSICDQNSMISYSAYSANKQVRFLQNPSSEDILQSNNGQTSNGNDNDATVLMQQRPVTEYCNQEEHDYYHKLNESQETTKNHRRLSILSKKRAASPKLRNEARSTSQSRTFEKDSRHFKIKQAYSTQSRNNRLNADTSGRSKSNKSRLSRRSSVASCRSTNQRSAKKSKAKHSRSVNQQQIEEYNKFSAKKVRKAAEAGVQVITLKAVKASASKPRGGESSAKKKRSVSRSKDGSQRPGKKFQTILIETDGLSSQQISQIDRVTRILNNERICKSPGGKNQRSSKKREASAKKKAKKSVEAAKLTIGSTSQFNSLNSRRSRSKNGERGQEALDRSLSRSQCCQDEAVQLGNTRLIQQNLRMGLANTQANRQARRKNFKHCQLIQSQQIQPSFVQNVQYYDPNSIQAPQNLMINPEQKHSGELIPQRRFQSSQNEIMTYPLQPHPEVSGQHGSNSALDTQHQFIGLHDQYASPKYTIDYPPASSFGVQGVQNNGQYDKEFSDHRMQPQQNLTYDQKRLHKQSYSGGLLPQYNEQSEQQTRLPPAQSQQQMAHQVQQVTNEEGPQQQQPMMAFGPRGHHHGQSAEPIQGSGQDQQQVVCLPYGLDTLHTVQGGQSSYYPGMSNPTQMTASTLQYQNQNQANQNYQRGNLPVNIHDQRYAGQGDAEGHMVEAHDQKYQEIHQREGEEAPTNRVVGAPRFEQKDPRNLESPVAEAANENKMIDQLDNLSQKKNQDIQKSSQKSMQKIKSYNNNDINDVVDQFASGDYDDKQLCNPGQQQILSDPCLIAQGTKQTNDANSNTILTNTTYTSKLCTSNHMHSFDLTLQYQNQMKQQPIENKEENLSSIEDAVQGVDGDHRQEDQDEVNSQIQCYENEIEKQENEHPSSDPKIPFCSENTTKLGNSQVINHHAMHIQNELHVAQHGSFRTTTRQDQINEDQNSHDMAAEIPKDIGQPAEADFDNGQQNQANEHRDEFFLSNSHDAFPSNQVKAQRNAQKAKFISFNDSQRLYSGINGHASLQQRTLENQDLNYPTGNADMRSRNDLQFVPTKKQYKTELDPPIHVANYVYHENQPQNHLWQNPHLHMTSSSDYPQCGPQSSYYAAAAANGQNMDFQIQRPHPMNNMHVYQNMAQITDGPPSLIQSTNKMSQMTSPQNTIPQNTIPMNTSYLQQQHSMLTPLTEGSMLRHSQMAHGQTMDNDSSARQFSQQYLQEDPRYYQMPQEQQYLPQDLQHSYCTEAQVQPQTQVKESRSKSQKHSKLRRKSNCSEDVAEPRVIAIKLVKQKKLKVRKQKERSPSMYSQKSAKSKISQISQKRLSKKKKSALAIEQQTLSSIQADENKKSKTKGQRSPSVMSKNSKRSKKSAKKVKKSSKRVQEGKKQEPRNAKSTDAQQRLLTELHDFYLKGIRQVYQDIAQVQERSAAMVNRGQQQSRDLMVVGDHLQQESRMSNRRQYPGFVDAQQNDTDDTSMLLQGSMNGQGIELGSLNNTGGQTYVANGVTFANPDGLLQDVNAHRHTRSKSLHHFDSRGNSNGALRFANEVDHGQPGSVVVNEEADPSAAYGLQSQPSHLTQKQQEQLLLGAQTTERGRQTDLSNHLQEQVADKVNEFPDELLAGETTQTRTRHISQLQGGDLVNAPELHEIGPGEQRNDQPPEISIPSSLIFDLNTNQFFKQDSNGTLVPVSNLNVQMMQEHHRIDQQMIQKEESQKQSHQSHHSLRSSHRPLQQANSNLMQYNLETPGFHESNGNFHGGCVRRSQGVGSRVVLAWQQSNHHLENEALQHMKTEAGQGVPADELLRTTSSAPEGQARVSGPFHSQSRSSNLHQRSVAGKQYQDQSPFNNCFQDLESQNLIANIQLGNQKFDNQFHKQSTKSRSAKSAQGRRLKQQHSASFAGKRASQTPTPQLRSNGRLHQQSLLNEGSTIGVLPEAYENQMRSKSSRLPANSNKASIRYLKSIDRIVKHNKIAGTNPKKCRQYPFVSQRRLSSEMGRRRSRDCRGLSTASVHSVRLPKRRLIVSPTKQRSKKPKSRLQTYRNADIVLTPNQSKKEKRASRLRSYKRQQETVERLHNQGQKTKANTGGRSHTLLKSPWREGLCESAARPTAHRRCSTPIYSATRRSSNRGNGGCSRMVQIARDSMQKAVEAKHERELHLQQQEYDQKVQGINRQWKTRLEFCKHRIQTEKTRAQNYRETIKEMAEKIDRVGQKNSHLYQKAKMQRKNESNKSKQPKQCYPYDYQTKKESTISNLKKDYSSLQQSKRPSDDPTMMDHVHYYEKEEPTTIHSNPLYSNKICTSSESAVSRPGDGRSSVRQSHRREHGHKPSCNRSKSKKSAGKSKSGTQSRKSSLDLRRDASAGQSRPFMVDKSVTQSIAVTGYGASDDRQQYRREANGGKFIINQPSAFECRLNANSGRAHIECRDESAGLSNIIDLQKSAMLEPSICHTIEPLPQNYSLLPNHTHRRDTTRSSGRACSQHQAKSQIVVGGQKLPVSYRQTLGNWSNFQSKNPSQLFTQINKQESAEDFTMTQTSSYLSEMPTVNFQALSSKIAANHQEIRRIEKILYKDESKTAKYKKPKNMLSAQNKNVQIFAEKVHQLVQKNTLTKHSNPGSQRSQNKQRGASALIDDTSLQKLKKLDRLDKESAKRSNRTSVHAWSKGTLSYKQF